MIDEFVRLVRRVCCVVLAAPLLLWGGWWVGGLTHRAIELPDGVPVRPDESTTPRVTIDALGQHLAWLERGGERTEDLLAVYREHVAPVEGSLVRRGVERGLARRVAWPLVAYSARNELDPATVLAVLLIESEGRPRATSSVGARGLMQVMPAHIGLWDDCRSADLYDIDANLCYGTNILASNLRRFRGDERRALLAYNGCVRGTNTPNCHIYPDRVERVRRSLAVEWGGEIGDRRIGVAGLAAAP